MIKSAPSNINKQTGDCVAHGGADLTIEQVIKKYDNKIRGVIYKRCAADEFDDIYQNTIMNIMNYLPRINELSEDAQEGYIITVAKHFCTPWRKSDKKLRTYNSWTNDDGEDNTEEWLLEDDTYNPETMYDTAEAIEQKDRAIAYKIASQSARRFICSDVYMDHLLPHNLSYRTPEIRNCMKILKKLRTRCGCSRFQLNYNALESMKNSQRTLVNNRTISAGKLALNSTLVWIKYKYTKNKGVKNEKRK